MREKSEVTQRQSHSAKITLGVAIMMQGMLHMKRKVLGSSSLACSWPAVMGLPSVVHVHSHGSSFTEVAAR